MDKPPPTHLRGARPSGGAKSSFSLHVAFRVADSYFDAGSRQYRLLHDDFDAAISSGDIIDFDRALRFGVPAVSNLSFSLELFLKVLQAQCTGSYPAGHKIGDLFGALPKDAKHRIKRNFTTSCHDDSFPYLTDFTLETSINETSGGLNFRVIASDDGRPDANDSSVVPSAIQMANDLFTVWRYIYEHGARVGQLSADFFGLNHLINAVRMDVIAFEGPAIYRGK